MRNFPLKCSIFCATASLKRFRVHFEYLVVSGSRLPAAVAVRGRKVQHPIRTDADGADASEFSLEVLFQFDNSLAIERCFVESFSAKPSEEKTAPRNRRARRRPRSGAGV